MVIQLKPSIFQFLNLLKENNNRDWFQANKADYEAELAHVVVFADKLLEETKKHDTIETISGKKSLFRIYRDVRFSKEKSPYKTWWSGSFTRATKQLRGGYYFHLEQGNSFVAGGFWNPEKEDLLRIRQEIANYEDEFRNILKNKIGKLTFEGDQLKMCPKGFDKEHSAVDLLRYKQFILIQKFTDEEVLDSDIINKMNASFKNMRLFFDFMSLALTTDANGVPIH
ncbi:MAG: TIGR02453 family protein [Flavobacteriales bacterium CG18_big_fil_WC_8_21_14_2_50_32_9]|nr:MAG: TIGR02453 family protein [Flavobacteriales bacterium CG18_big_fil_WC_8_21_14_2_50_32_9]